MNLVKRLGIVLLVLILFMGGWLTIHLLQKPEPLKSQAVIIADSTVQTIDSTEHEKQDEEELSVAESEFLNDSSYVKQNASNEAAYLLQKDTLRKISPSAKRINIAVIGLDARMGTLSKRADANHVISIVPDSGYIEIVSIPRDTPADAGMKDTTQNKLTIVHVTRGVKAYLKEVGKIAKVGPVNYWIQLGFSQAMGLIELLGHRDSKSTLQVLRSRKGLGGDDYQRCFNQGQYIRQMILNHFHKADGIMGELLIRGGLALMKSNLSTEGIKGLVYDLNKAGFPKDASAIEVRVRPETGIKFKVYNFSDSASIKKLKNKIERFNAFMAKKDTSYAKKSIDPAGKLNRVLNALAADTAEKPKKVLEQLYPYFEQHAWLQVRNETERDAIRTRLGDLMIHSFYKIGKPDNARWVKYVIDTEKAMFSGTSESAKSPKR
jgi:anionic cell wall polymer biosynthesis LytR-Cps2A-Psr (LCP) family protein